MLFPIGRARCIEVIHVCQNSTEMNKNLYKLSQLTALSNIGKPSGAPHSVKQTRRKCAELLHGSVRDSFECFRAALCICQYMIGIDKIPQVDMNVTVTSC